MPEIYSGAERVIIWLGPDSAHAPSVKPAMALLCQLLDLFVGYHSSSDFGGWLRLATENPTWRAEFVKEVRIGIGSLGVNVDTWQTLAATLRRPWFYRIWCVQEAVLAGCGHEHPAETIFVCGVYVLPWKDMVTPLLSMHIRGLHDYLQGFLSETQHNPTLHKPFSGGVTTLLFMDQLRKEGIHISRPSRFYRLLRLTRSLDSTDPRDKVFALFGLLKPDKAAIENGALRPDNTKPVKVVFEDVAKHFMLHLHSLKLLELVHDTVRSRTELTEALPSWVPNWTTSSDAPVLDDFAYCAGHSLQEQGIPWSDGETATSEFEVCCARNAKLITPSLHLIRPIVEDLGSGSVAIQGLLLGPLKTTVLAANECVFHIPQLPVEADCRLQFQALKLCRLYTEIVKLVRSLNCASSTTSTRDDLDHPLAEQRPVDLELPSSAAPYALGGTMVEASWRTLIGDRTEDYKQPATEEWQTYFIAFHQVQQIAHKYGPKLPKGLVSNSMDALASRYFGPLLRILSGRRFAILSCQILCLVPQRATAGEFVCIFNGSDIPHVIRPRPRMEGVEQS
ncbi:hypothetical protein LTR78_008052 [Recurvomyces mirabilis]|uniref:Heterokaryon incompatibility domain-containing protein n=1 Tax=Recurvomyces mirabilis TaxID=574656 RepID=A0AAE0TQU3_9PEZI|nr:hypothetical protein LTR78_008052 [Recurvomyces mirabilis]KAK5150780.1 hypothetical protein LTS14_009843 [Recurvomyces mirabilis]